jgi:hypothetical protein
LAGSPPGAIVVSAAAPLPISRRAWWPVHALCAYAAVVVVGIVWLSVSSRALYLAARQWVTVPAQLSVVVLAASFVVRQRPQGLRGRAWTLIVAGMGLNSSARRTGFGSVAAGCPRMGSAISSTGSRSPRRCCTSTAAGRSGGGACGSTR